jgi:poly-gamma-glutamate capsule biosynthesis protein CapA/YwtB (metallophosphatase superfamily)
VVNLANNHAMDYGAEAMLQTRTHLADAGSPPPAPGPTSARPPSRSSSSATACASACSAPATAPPSQGRWPRRRAPASRPADAAWLLPAVEALKTRVDQVVLMLHWGLEYSPLPTPEQVELAHAAIERGAGLIIGHHSHCIQGIERYRGGLIAYSLANLTDDRVDVTTPSVTTRPS